LLVQSPSVQLALPMAVPLQLVAPQLAP